MSDHDGTGSNNVIKISSEKTEYRMERQQLADLAMSAVELLGMVNDLNEKYRQAADTLYVLSKLAADVPVPLEIEEEKRAMINSWREAVDYMRQAQVKL